MKRSFIFCTVTGWLLSAMWSVATTGNEPADQPSSNDLAMNIASLAHVHSETSRPHINGQGSTEPKLEQVLQLAHNGLKRLDEVKDYTCTLVRRERVHGKLMPEQTVFAKVRHESGSEPGCMSLYMRFNTPEGVHGREILFSNREKSSDDSLKLLVRNGGKRMAFLTAEIAPTSKLAMHGNRYPITEFGLRRLIERMILFGEKEKSLQGGKLLVRSNVELDGVRCTLIEVGHESADDGSDYHIARVLIDEQLQLPIHFSSYTWPDVFKAEDKGDKPIPVLVESYTYRDLKLNVNLCDQDFDRNNPEYKFSKR